MSTTNGLMSAAVTRKINPAVAAMSDDKDGPASGVGSLHQDVYREGREALDRIRAGRHFMDWIPVAKAVGAGRAEAMTIAETNQPIGSRFCKVFGEVLKREELGKDKLDSATRSQLLTILKHLPEIEEWHQRLDPIKRMKNITQHRSTSLVRDRGRSQHARQG